jgi:opacity protein-like surface antigen
VGACLVSAVPIDAADRPAIELSGAFSSLASGACCLWTAGTVPVGWGAGVTVGVHEWLSVVVEVGGDYETTQPQTPHSLPLPAAQTRIYAYLAGPRVAVDAARKVRVFGQVLLGGTQHEAAFVVPGAPFPGYSSINHFTWQPGGGVDVGVARHWAVRLEGDYRLTPVAALVPARSFIAQPRFASGVVFRP